MPIADPDIGEKLCIY